MTATEVLDLVPVLTPFALYELRRGVSALVASAASLARIEALLLGGAAARATPAPEHADELPPDLLAALRAHLARPQSRDLAATAGATP
jgi:hypothetical protein